MSQTGTPTEFLQLGITEPDDTLNVLVDLNGQWRKIDTGVKNVDIKATTNASNITTLQGAVQDNTENITNILDTNVNQQNSIDTLQTKVAALEEDDTSYGSRITAVENGVQENSELINDLEVEVSGVKLDMGTVPSGSNLQGEVDGLDTRVTALENSGSVASVEARVTALEGSVGTVPAGETVEGQISDLDTDVTSIQGQVNSGNIPFRFSVDGGGNYGYLKADDSFVPFSSGDSHWHELDKTLYQGDSGYSYIVRYNGFEDSTSPNYKKVHDLLNNIDYTLPVSGGNFIGCVIHDNNNDNGYLLSNGNITNLTNVVGVIFDNSNRETYYLTKNGNAFQYNAVDNNGFAIGLPVDFTISGSSSSPITFRKNHLYYRYSNTSHNITMNTTDGNITDTIYSSSTYENLKFGVTAVTYAYGYNYSDGNYITPINNTIIFNYADSEKFLYRVKSSYYYYT